MSPQLDDVAGLGRAFVHEGREYRVREPSILDRAKLVRWVKSRAYAEIAASEMGDDEKRVARRMLVEDVAAGVYDYHGELVARTLASVPGFGYLLYLCAHEHGQPQLTEAEAYELFAARNEEAIEITAKLANSDPKNFAGRADSSPTGPPSSPGSSSTAT